MIIQEGLSTSVAMFIQMLTFCIVVVVIMFYIDIATTFVAVVLILPGALISPVFGKRNRALTDEH